MPRMTGPETVVRTFGHSTRSNRHRTRIRYEPPASPAHWTSLGERHQLSFPMPQGGAINMSPDDPIAVLCRAKRKISEPWGPHAHGMMTRA